MSDTSSSVQKRNLTFFFKVDLTRHQSHSLLDVLSAAEQRAIKVTWKHMKGKAGLRKADKLMVGVFEKLSKKQPICSVFMKAMLLESSKSMCSVYEHGRMLSKLLDQMICPEEYHLHVKEEEETLLKIGICIPLSKLFPCETQVLFRCEIS